MDVIDQLKCSGFYDSCSPKPFKSFYIREDMGYVLGIKYGVSYIERPNIVFSLQGSCHASVNTLSNHNKNGMHKFYSQLRVGHEDDRISAEQYWRDLFNPEISPWRSVLDGLEIIYSKEKKMIAFSIPCDKKYPAQVVINLCIATRKMAEEASFARNYLHFRNKYGPRNTIIMFMLGTFTLTNHRSINYYWSTSAHHPIDVNSCDIRGFATGNYKKSAIVKKNTIDKSFSYTPCNTIWDTNIADKMSANSIKIDMLKSENKIVEPNTDGMKFGTLHKNLLTTSAVRQRSNTADYINSYLNEVLKDAT